jgi:hypothetical protein
MAVRIKPIYLLKLLISHIGEHILCEVNHRNCLQLLSAKQVEVQQPKKPIVEHFRI